MKAAAGWLIVFGALGMATLAPRNVDLWWASTACAIGWIVCARKRPTAAAFQDAFGTAYLTLIVRELLQHRWFG